MYKKKKKKKKKGVFVKKKAVYKLLVKLNVYFKLKIDPTDWQMECRKEIIARNASELETENIISKKDIYPTIHVSTHLLKIRVH